MARHKLCEASHQNVPPVFIKLLLTTCHNHIQTIIVINITMALDSTVSSCAAHPNFFQSTTFQTSSLDNLSPGV